MDSAAIQDMMQAMENMDPHARQEMMRMMALGGDDDLDDADMGEGLQRATLDDLKQIYATDTDDANDPAHLMALRGMAAMGMRDPREKYKNVELVRMECSPDAEKFIRALEPHVGPPGPIVDIGSMSGFIPACFQDRWPEYDVIASDVEVPFKMDPTGFWGMPLLRNFLKTLADDARPPHRERYLAMRDKVAMIDVLQPMWSQVQHLHGTCAAVVCTSLLNMKGFETPDMWRMALVGAAQLLRDAGVLLLYDSDFGDLGVRSVVEIFAKRVGLDIVIHQFDHRGSVGPTMERDFFQVLFKRSATAPICDLAKGDVVEVIGLKSRADLNGTTAVLGNCVNGRYEAHVAAGETANRKVESVRIKPENLRSLMDPHRGVTVR